MSTRLSNGVDLAALSATELAALLAAAYRLKAGQPAEEPDTGDTRTTCIVSPHTGACTRCGVPGGKAICDTQAGHQFAARLDMRRTWKGTHAA